MSVKLEDVGLNRNDDIVKIANVNPVFSTENEKISDVAKKILKTSYRRLPILGKNGVLSGIVTIMDILDAFLRNVDFNGAVNSIMARDVIVCNYKDTIDFVLKKFKFSRRGGFPIAGEKNKLAGIVSERDIVKHFFKVPFNVKVKDVMTRKPFIVHENLSVLDALKTMVNTKYRRLPVVNDGKLVGIITSADLLQHIHNNGFVYFKGEPLDVVVRRHVFTVSGNVDLSEAVRIMKEKDVGGLLVVDGAAIEGIITERDILGEIF